MKRKLLVALVLFLIVGSFAFAKEGDVRVTRTDTTRFAFDMGVAIRLPLQDEVDTAKKGGVYGALSVTPFEIDNIGLGFKFVGTFVGTKSMLTGGGGVKARLKRSELSASILAAGTVSLAKSFEIYGGLGPEYVLFNIKSKKDYKQCVGLAVEAGGRGRITDHFGVGVQIDYFKARSKKNNNNFVDLKAYISVEL